MAESMPTLKHGQAIRGHYRAGNELVIHARPCLALLPAYMAALSHVPHLRILGALWTNSTQIGQGAAADWFLRMHCGIMCVTFLPH